MKESIVALPHGRVSQLTGLSKRQLDYWSRTQLVRPSIERRLSERNWVRVYGFYEVVELMVIAQLLDREITLPQIRSVVGYLRRKRGRKAPLRELRFATAGGEIYFQEEDGSWHGGRAPAQAVLRDVIPLEEVRNALRRRIREREAEQAGRVERRRGRLGSKPVFAGTRIPVDTVKRYLRAGFEADRILEAFPDLTAADVETARRQLAA